MKQHEAEQQVDARSRSWCTNCEWKRWGIWSQRDGYRHHRDEGHFVHVLVPDEEGPLCDDSALIDGTMYMCGERGEHDVHVDETDPIVRWS